MLNQFPEAKLSKSFAKKIITDLNHLIDQAVSFSITSIPNIGTSVLLRYLSLTNRAKFIFVDCYELAEYDEISLLTLFLKTVGVNSPPSDLQNLLSLCQQTITNLTNQSPQKLVIIFNRFSFLEPAYTNKLFHHLRLIRNANGLNVCMIFAIHQPFYIVAPSAISDSNLNMFSQEYYFRGLSGKELIEFFTVHTPHLVADESKTKTAVKLAGNHYQLLQVLLKSSKTTNYLEDPYVRICLEELAKYLNYDQRQQVNKIILEKPITKIDELLINTGYVINENNKYRLFSPLLAEYLKLNLSDQLPVKEQQLFDLLYTSLGKTVTKDIIFDALWKKDSEDASDWSLNALIYRLRRNHQFKNSGYTIKSHKKLGYSMNKLDT